MHRSGPKTKIIRKTFFIGQNRPSVTSAMAQNLSTYMHEKEFFKSFVIFLKFGLAESFFSADFR